MEGVEDVLRLGQHDQREPVQRATMADVAAKDDGVVAAQRMDLAGHIGIGLPPPPFRPMYNRFANGSQDG